MPFNPLANFNQGLQAGQNVQAAQRQNQINALQGSIGQQSAQGGLNPNNSLEFQQLSTLDPNASAQILSNFNNLDKSRKKALFQDAREARKVLESGDGEGFLNIVSSRLESIERLGGDPSQTMNVLNAYNSGDIQGALGMLNRTEQAGVDLGLIKDLSGGNVSVQSSKILDDGSVIQVLKGGGRQVISTTGEILTGEAAKNAVRVSRDQAFNRKKELARLGQLIRREESNEGLLSEQQSGIQKLNIQRLGELSKTSTGRQAAIKKATKFKLALDKGEVQSGAGRIGASFIPGVFTKQAQFDEEFNAFAEIAARQQLKASGETKPTDPDVEGMKRAMFGIGRDEQVNIILLNDFIKAQQIETGELDQLINASKTGNLSNFTFTPTNKAVVVGDLSDEDLFK